MDEGSGNLSSSYSPLLNPSSDTSTRSRDGSDPPARLSSGSWSFRSNSFPKSPSSDTSTSSGKGPAAWAKNIQSWTSSSKDSQSSGSGSKSSFTNLFSNIGFNKQTTVKIPVVDGPFESTSAPTSPLTENGPLNSIKTGFLTGSRNAVKAVQTKARHMVSQNKRRYQVNPLMAWSRLLRGQSASVHLDGLLFNIWNVRETLSEREHSIAKVKMDMRTVF